MKFVRSVEFDTNNLLKANAFDHEAALNLSNGIATEWMDWHTQAQTMNLPETALGVNPGDRRALFSLIRYFKPNSVLEVGTHIGASTLSIATALDENFKQSNRKAKFKTIDIRDVNSEEMKPWLKFGAPYSPREMMQRLSIKTEVTFVSGDSLKFLRQTQETFDFIFLDGDHSAKNLVQEIPEALKKLNPNGVIVLHDYYPKGEPIWPNKPSIVNGPYIALESIMESNTTLGVLPLGNLPWETKLGSQATSLALLLRK
ncbi:O-methyltransferase [Nitritalea halalkaliphila]|nr:class I SAM-dependent methyltransferase [Nitritalea halalkaliphila]